MLYTDGNILPSGYPRSLSSFTDTVSPVLTRSSQHRRSLLILSLFTSCFPCSACPLLNPTTSFTNKFILTLHALGCMGWSVSLPAAFLMPGTVPGTQQAVKYVEWMKHFHQPMSKISPLCRQMPSEAFEQTVRQGKCP